MASPRWRDSATVALFAILTFASLAPVRSYDLFWHLATGRWIVEHGSLPLTDPFALASAQVPWINGEWLFQLLAHGLERLGGITALSWLRAIVAGLIFAAGFWFAARRADMPAAGVLCAVGWAGALATLDARPSAFGALMTVVMILAAEKRSPVGALLATVVWINIHPSALIAPAVALLLARRASVVAAACAGLLINPYGIHGVLAPLELTSAAAGGEFVNAEWLPSLPQQFPLLFVVIAVAVLLFLRSAAPREDAGRAVLLALLAILAVRHVRNQNLFFAALPLLVAPVIPRVTERWRRIAAAVAAAIVVLVSTTNPHGAGIASDRFPVAPAAAIKAHQLRGNVYNPDQFGGYLIWSLYPERRVLTDGRNELHRDYIADLGRARTDQRAWRALLAKYRIDLAVEEMLPPLPVKNAATGQIVEMPASLAFWPRREWALIGHDRASVLFARRAAFPPQLIERLEMKGIVPDAPVQAGVSSRARGRE